MDSAAVNLVIYYFGFGFVLVLLWAALLSDVVLGTATLWTHRLIMVLRIVGFVHPVAAVAAWDLSRLRGRGDEHQRPSRPGERVPLLASVVIAVAVLAAAAAS